MRHTKQKSETLRQFLFACVSVGSPAKKKKPSESVEFVAHMHMPHIITLVASSSQQAGLLYLFSPDRLEELPPHSPPPCWFPPFISLIKTSGVSSSIIMMKPEGRLSKFPYKGPNSTSSSFAVECWPGEPSHAGALWLKRPPPPAPPTPPYRKHIQKTHMQSRRTDPNSLGAHVRVIYLSWTPVHAEERLCSPVGSPSQSDMVREERRGPGQRVLLSAEFLHSVESSQSVE